MGLGSLLSSKIVVILMMVIVDQILADLFYINNATKFWQEPQPHWWNAAPNNDRASSMILIHLKFGFMTTKDNLTLIFSPVLPTLKPQHFILVFLSNKCLLTVNIRWFNWSAKHISQFVCQSFAWFFSCFLWTWLEIWFICIRWFHRLLLLSFNLSSFLWFFLPKYANLSENSYLGSILLAVFEKEC